MPVTADDLAVDFFPRVGDAPAPARLDAWRQAHHAAQALVHLGKSWGTPRDDDAHSALTWSHEDAGWLAGGSGPLGDVIGWADFGAASLWLERRDPQEGAWIETEGRTAGELVAWARAAAERLTGEPARQTATPAPDLPAHPVAEGEAFGVEDADARADVEALYEGAGLLLDALVQSLGDRYGADDDEAMPRLWPHHFDAASLFVLARAGDGSMDSTIGVGLAPPDAAEASGYWYVSPWSRGGEPRGRPREIPSPGLWSPRDGAPPMAVLPLSDLVRLRDGDEQHARVAGFVAAAFNACLEMLDA